MKSLAIITTHPIQYNAPWFRLLAQRKKLSVKVFYTWGQLEKANKYDPGFGKNVEWDIPLLEGYDYTFVENISADAGSHHYKGIDNPGLIKEIESWNPGAILVFGWNFKSHLKVLRYFKGKKAILFRGDSTLLDENPGFSLKKLFRKIFLAWVYNHIDAALYVGAANKAYYLKFGLQEKQLKFAPHAIDNQRFHCGSNNNLRHELSVPENGIIFLFAGKLEPKKNPMLLLEAFLQMNDPDAYLVIVGNGVLEENLKQRANSLSSELKSRIHFIDFKNQQSMPGVYKTADVFVLPSSGPGETWGLAVNEAMACGRPVLVSNKCGCFEDLVIESVTGYTFESGDTEDLARKMKRMVLNSNNLSAMKVASLETISNWSFLKICEAIETSIK